MTSWTGKTKGNLLGYKFFILLINSNIKFAYILLFPVTFFYLLVSNKKSSKYYFTKIHGYGTFKTIVSIYKNYLLLGRVIIDKIALLSGKKHKYTFDFEGEEFLRQMVDLNKGGLLLGAHMGNWEIAGQLLERIDTTVNIVMLDAEREKIKKLLDDVLVKKNVNIIAVKNDFSHLFAITKAFENNEFVVMHGDRFMDGANNITVNFLGKEARFPSGPLYLASKNKVPVSFVFTLKETNTHYHFYATKGKVFKYPGKIKTRKEDLKIMVNEYVQTLEHIIRKYPLQWFNYYPFWNEENK